MAVDKKPVIFLAFANDRVDDSRYLRNLPKEQRLIRGALERARLEGLCEYIERANSTADDILDVFQNPDYRNRIAVFHFAGHANSYQLLLESEEGGVEAAEARGLAAFLGQQRGLQLVFLNGCSTRQQTEELLDANVSAVIATSQAINDWAAMKFAVRFYRGLAGGANIEKAYREAEAAVRTSKGDSFRNVYVADAPQTDRWPWELRVRRGAEITGQWNLPESVGNPLFSLPPLKHADLPEKPFRHLHWFTRADAEVFFGRGHQIRELYDRVTDLHTPPVILFYGQSGVGKSSVLEAGLMPRLEPNYEVRYLRRNQELGLSGTFNQAFSVEDGAEPSARGWLSAEALLKRPLVVILDQVEEAYTRPHKDGPEELSDFLSTLEALFANPCARPLGKLILSFRKEWLPEIEQKLKEHKLARAKIFLERLDREGVIESITGSVRSERLRNHYGLTVEDGLAAIVADDLLEDQDSPLAPTLQILLTKMWDEATKINGSRPRFDKSLYTTLKTRGILLGDFLDQQLAEVRMLNPDSTNSGLALDLLVFHTTPLGTAEQRTAEELDLQYKHRKDALAELVRQYKTLYLLADPASDQSNATAVSSTRLAHDTLAPLVRLRFDKSVAPGQIARRILENRSVEWQNGQTGTPLDERDLKTVEKGEGGMRDRTPEEELLVAASRKERERKRVSKRNTRLTVAALVLMVLGVFGLVWYRQWAAEKERSRLADERNRLLYRSLAQKLSQQAIQQQNDFQYELSALMARQAFLFNKLGKEPITNQVDAALRAVEISPLFPPSIKTWRYRNALLTYTSDGRMLAERDGFRIIRLAKDYSSWILSFQDAKRRYEIRLFKDQSSTLPANTNVQVVPVAFSQNQQVVASVAGPQPSDTVQLWEWQNPGSPPRLERVENSEIFWLDSPSVSIPHPKETVITSLAFSQDGQTLAAGTLKGEVYLWQWRQANPTPVILRQSRDRSITEIEFSPDGQTLAAGIEGYTVLLWKTGRPEEPPAVRSFENKDQYSEQPGRAVVSLAFSPDGKRLAGCNQRDIVQLWELDQTSTATVPALRYDAHSASCSAVAFSRDGNALAASFIFSKVGPGSPDDEKLLVWDLRRSGNSPRAIGTARESGNVTQIISLAFSQDGEVLASAYRDGRVFTRFLNLENLSNAICGRVKRNLLAVEWEMYVGKDVGYQCTCANLPPPTGAPPCQK